MRIVFMGSPAFAIPALEACHKHHDVVAVYCQPDKAAGRGKKLRAPAIKVRAQELALEVFQPKSMRPVEVEEQMRSHEAEIAVVVAYGKILPKHILEVFPHGCVNIHGSLLPKYRGAGPLQWAIINGEEKTGVSIMKLDEGMDTGPVYQVTEMDIRDEDTVTSLGGRMATRGAETLLAVLADIATGVAVATDQEHSHASHARMLTKEDGTVSFEKSAWQLSCLIRGVDPWPGASAAHRDKSLKLFGPQLTDLPMPEGAQQGEVLSVGQEGMVLVCNASCLLVREVQWPGKRRMAVADFARGGGIVQGEILGAGTDGES